jgi:hypothetical protein
MGERSMQTHKCIFPAFTLTAAMTVGLATMAAELPKEGTFKGTYSAMGTYKVNPIDKDRVLSTFDETGLDVTDGFIDHMIWHCWGTGDMVRGVEVDQGHCTATDVSGDKLAAKFVSEKHAPDQKNVIVTMTCDGGTGKYAGASCTNTGTTHGGEFPPAPEGTYYQYQTFQGTYKLP